MITICVSKMLEPYKFEIQEWIEKEKRKKKAYALTLNTQRKNTVSEWIFKVVYERGTVCFI